MKPMQNDLIFILPASRVKLHFRPAGAALRIVRLALVVFLSGIAGGVPMEARMIWREVFPEYDMPRIESHNMAFDQARNETFMFSGNIYPQSRYNIGFFYDGINWRRQEFWDDAPSPRMDFGMTYDSNRELIIIFGGGRSGGEHLGDTWEWDGEAWEQKFPEHHPTDRYGNGLCFNSHDNLVYLFGGYDETYVPKNDLWVWDGLDWIQLYPSTSPTPRLIMGFIYNILRDRIVLFGGTENGADGFNDTWEYYDDDWHEVNIEHKPPGLYYHTMVYDSHRDRCIIFGGVPNGSGFNSDTWEYDGVDWEKLNVGYPSPVGRGASAACFDTVRNRMVMFGGYGDGPEDDTWEYYEAPTVTPTPTITQTPTVTGTPTSTPTPSPSPTSTPACTQTGVRLFMPSHDFNPGDPCSLTAVLCNLTGEPLDRTPFFCLLAYESFYWFYPDWTADAAWTVLDIDPGETPLELIQTFTWPGNTGHSTGFAFISAITDPDITRIVGSFDTWEFEF